MYKFCGDNLRDHTWDTNIDSALLWQHKVQNDVEKNYDEWYTLHIYVKVNIHWLWRFIGIIADDIIWVK